MTEQEIKDLGFKKVKSYKHDIFTTNRYEKGVLEVEFTYRGFNLETVDLTIEEINCMDIKKQELIQLNKILNK